MDPFIQQLMNLLASYQQNQKQKAAQRFGAQLRGSVAGGQQGYRLPQQYGGDYGGFGGDFGGVASLFAQLARGGGPRGFAGLPAGAGGPPGRSPVVVPASPPAQNPLAPGPTPPGPVQAPPPRANLINVAGRGTPQPRKDPFAGVNVGGFFP